MPCVKCLLEKAYKFEPSNFRLTTNSADFPDRRLLSGGNIELKDSIGLADRLSIVHEATPAVRMAVPGGRDSAAMTRLVCPMPVAAPDSTKVDDKAVVGDVVLRAKT